VSANNVPYRFADPLVPQGNANDRVQRMGDLLGEERTYTLDELGEIQRDTYSAASASVRDLITELAPGPSPLVDTVTAWDGRYDRDSAGAAAYQRLLSHLIDELYRARYSEAIIGSIRSGPYIHTFVAEDLRAEGGAESLIRAIDAAERGWDPATAWGDVHRLRLDHPLGAIPVLGAGYRFENFPYGGSTTTIFKGAHRVQPGVHQTTFGANARLLCDMGTLDDNRVVLLGGQDGWLGSDRLLDQADLWQRGAYIELPMTIEAQRARAVRTHTLVPTAD